MFVKFSIFGKYGRQPWICRWQQQSGLGVGRLRWKICVGLVGGGSSIWSSFWVHTDGVGGIPTKVAQLMSDPPLDPPFRFPSWEGWSSILRASGYADEDDSLGPPFAEGWQFFWPWCQMASDMMDGQQKHFLHMRPTCNAPSLGG